jgi:UDP-N-acetylmuramoyl-tripeptide--D-alanyl-D-alanine ligase
MKKVKLNIKDFFAVPSAEIFNPDMLMPIEAVSIDSRHIPPKCLFAAIKGDRFDGHDFIKDALGNGASAILIKKKKYVRFKDLGIPVITVEDTVKALGFIAGIWRNKLNTKIIGITGSAGKTSVKEFIAVLLNEKYKVNRTLANHNNHIGVPLTLFSTNNFHEYLVLELGTNHFGEIEYTSDIAKPDIALITNIGSSHLEYLKNEKGVLKEKAALMESVIRQKGYIFINTDDKYLKNLYTDYKKRITYGLVSKADVKGSIAGYTEDGKPLVSITYKNRTISVELPLWGDQSAKNFIAAAAVALHAGLNIDEIKSGSRKLKSYDKRFVMKEYDSTVIIDDTYNANPESMKNAIAMLQKVYPDKDKVAVLGDMLELGTSSTDLHKKLAAVVKKHKIDRLYTIGILSKNIYLKLKGSPVKTRHFISRSSLKRFLQDQKFDNTVLLFKGSRGMKMEEFLNVTEAKFRN